MLKWFPALAAVLALVLPAAALAGLTRPERQLLERVNLVRVERGLGPLRFDVHLERAARSHSRSMLTTGVFAHGAFAQRMLQFDVTGSLAGEDLAWGTGTLGTARGVVSAWLASPEHRANLLRPSFTRVGIAVRVGTFLGHPEARVVTADFAG